MSAQDKAKVAELQPYDLLERDGHQRVFVGVLNAEGGDKVIFKTRYIIAREYTTPLRRWVKWQAAAKLVRRIPQESKA